MVLEDILVQVGHSKRVIAISAEIEAIGDERHGQALAAKAALCEPEIKIPILPPAHRLVKAVDSAGNASRHQCRDGMQTATGYESLIVVWRDSVFELLA